LIRLLVTIDTEEDNWIPTRDDLTVENIRTIPRLQAILERYGVRPTYLTTYQVAVVPWAAEILAGLAESGLAEIGAHLHPWNTPPGDEPVDEWTVGWKNLPADLKRDKLEALTAALTQATGRRPTSFRSGRWSISSSCVGLLAAQGYRTDSSVLPYYYWYDFVDSPSFSRAPVTPYYPPLRGDIQRRTRHGPVVEVPPTVGFRRWPWSPQGPVDRVLRSPVPRALHLSGLAARVGLVDRIALCPELSTDEELWAVSEVAIRHGVGTLNLFLHSSTLCPGATSYTSSAAQVDAFLGRIDQWLNRLHALTTSIEPVTLSEAGARFRSAQ
jgi:peptidoglycan/xylan/chitin deacetylase (PgdA/CDA1 family)